MVCPHTTMVCPHTHAARCGLDSPAPLHLHRESVCSSQPRRTEAQCRDVTWTQRTAGRNAGRRRQRSIYMATAEQRRSVRDATAQNQTHRRDSSLTVSLVHRARTPLVHRASRKSRALIESLDSTTVDGADGCCAAGFPSQVQRQAVAVLRQRLDFGWTGKTRRGGRDGMASRGRPYRAVRHVSSGNLGPC